jgi:hypothetical protein
LRQFARQVGAQGVPAEAGGGKFSDLHGDGGE